MTNTEFTVIICTRDRVDMLRDTVAAVLERMSSFPNSRLVIVDNGSTDGTADYLRKLAADDDCVVIEQESTPGVYHTRVRGIGRGRGDFLLFLDDDMLPGANWPGGLIKELIENPRIGIAATAIDPIWESPRPKWMTDRLADNVFGASIRNGRQKYGFPQYAPCGSCAIRMCDFLGLYASPERKRIELGWGARAAPGGMVGGEDWDLSEIYIRNGFEVIGVDHVRTGHRAQANKLTPAYVLRKFEIDSRCRIRYARLAGYRLLSRRVLMLMAAYPVLWALDQAIELTGIVGPRSVTLQTYARRGRGLWMEVLWGIRGMSFPFYLAK